MATRADDIAWWKAFIEMWKSIGDPTDRKSPVMALGTQERLLQQFLNGNLPCYDRPGDTDALALLGALHLEWEALAKDGPPAKPVYDAFMARFVPAYNAVWNRTGKGLCAECGSFYTFTSTKVGRFCGDACANRARGDGEARKQATLRQSAKYKRHEKSCQPCKQGEWCVTGLKLSKFAREETKKAEPTPAEWNYLSDDEQREAVRNRHGDRDRDWLDAVQGHQDDE